MIRRRKTVERRLLARPDGDGIELNPVVGEPVRVWIAKDQQQFAFFALAQLVIVAAKKTSGLNLTCLLRLGATSEQKRSACQNND